MNIETHIEHLKPTRRHWRAWTTSQPALAGLDHDRLHHELRHGDQCCQDELLAALVRLAQHGPYSDTATLVLAGCLLPGLRHRVARYAARLDREEAMQVLLAGLCENIRAFDVDHRSQFLATHLLGMPTGRLRRAVAREQTWADHAGQAILSEADTEPFDDALPVETVLGLATTAGVLTPADAWIIAATRAKDVPLDDAARQLGLSYDMAKRQRRRAELRWATWWSPSHLPEHGGEGGEAA